MKKYISIIATLFLLICFPLNIFASNNTTVLPNEISAFIFDVFCDYSVKKITPLYDVNNNITTYIVTLNPVGYVIFSDSEVIECSHTTEYPINNEKNYYFGPLQIFKKTDSSHYLNLISSETLSDDNVRIIDNEFKSKKDEQVSEKSKLNSALSRTITPYALSEHNLPYAPRTYNYNPDGRCGSLALAITLMYYDDHIDSNVVPSWISGADSNGKYFSDLIKPHLENIDGQPGSSTTAELQSGANWYFSYRGISSQYSAMRVDNAAFSTYRARINANRPVIVDLNSHPTYKEHWVVGYGYYYQSTGTSERCLIIANDGWGNNGREISYSYVGNLVYFNQ